MFDSDVQCINANDDAVDNSKCDFGAKFSGDYSEGEVNDEHFYITYGDGQTIYGSLGYEKVTLGDVSVGKCIACEEVVVDIDNHTSQALSEICFADGNSRQPRNCSS